MRSEVAGTSTRKDEDSLIGQRDTNPATSKRCYACGRKTLKENRLGELICAARNCGRLQP